jgi:hypothetical protein
MVGQLVVQLRSYSVGARVDDWIWNHLPEAYVKVLALDPTGQLGQRAEKGRSQIAEKTFRGRGGDLRPDAFSYCLGALQRFEGMPKPEIQKISFEIAMLGSRGLDVNDPAEQYSLRSIPGKFSGLHLLCIEYVGFQIIDPKVDIGFDLSAEYAAARAMFRGGIDVAAVFNRRAG